MENSSSLEIKNMVGEIKKFTKAVEDKLQEISQNVEQEDKEIENRKDKKIWRTVQEVLYVNQCFQKEEIEGRKKEPESRMVRAWRILSFQNENPPSTNSVKEATPRHNIV